MRRRIPVRVGSNPGRSSTTTAVPKLSDAKLGALASVQWDAQNDQRIAHDEATWVWLLLETATTNSNRTSLQLRYQDVAWKRAVSSLEVWLQPQPPLGITKAVQLSGAAGESQPRLLHDRQAASGDPRMDTSAYFNMPVQLMGNSAPPAAADAPMLARMAKIGLVSGRAIDLTKLEPDVQAALKDLGNDLSPKFHPAGGRIRSSFAPPPKVGPPGVRFSGVWS